MPFWLRLEIKAAARGEAALFAAMMPTLEDWLGENVETEENRDRVRSKASGLGDLLACGLEDLQEELDLASWPGLARKRFLNAWRALKAAPGPQPAALPPADPSAGTPSPPRRFLD